MDKKKQSKQDEDFPLKCNLCGKLITFDTALVTLHEGVPVFVCKECSAKINKQTDN